MKSNDDMADWSDLPTRGLTDLERTLLIACTAAQNYIANTESELGMTLKSGDLLRAAIAKAEACVFSSTHNTNDCDKQTECCDLAAKERCEDCPWPTPAAADSNASAEARSMEASGPITALSQMTPQQFADLALALWRELRDLPVEQRAATLDRILADLKKDICDER